MKKIGLIGFGAIGQYLYDNLLKDGHEVAFIFVRKKTDGEPYSRLMINTQEELLLQCQRGVDLVVEAATCEAVRSCAATVLKYADMLILSSTALADQTFYEHMQQLCSQYKKRLLIPHGAVMGYDGIADGRLALTDVTITTTKTPHSLGRTDTARTIVYEGPTRKVCELYPRNVNVHAGAALAGLGFDVTRSVIVSDPAAEGNQHEIEVKGKGFAFKVQTCSETASRVSSAYTQISAYGSVQRILNQGGIVII